MCSLCDAATDDSVNADAGQRQRADAEDAQQNQVEAMARERIVQVFGHRFERVYRQTLVLRSQRGSQRPGYRACVRIRARHNLHCPLISLAQRVLQEWDVSFRRRRLSETEAPNISNHSDYQQWVALLGLQLDALAQRVLSWEMPLREDFIDQGDVGSPLRVRLGKIAPRQKRNAHRFEVA